MMQMSATEIAGTWICKGRLAWPEMAKIVAVIIFAFSPYFSTPAFAQTETELVTPSTAAEDEDSDGNEEKAVFIKMSPLTAPLLDDRSIKGNITMVLKLSVLKPENEEKIQLRTPKLADAFLNYLFRYGSSSASTGVMQLDVIMGSLQRLSDKLLGEGEVKLLLHQVSRSRAR